MIFHVFNTSLISGPETLVMPALATLKGQAQIVWLKESRIADEKQNHVKDYLEKLQLPYHTIPIKTRYDKQAIQELADFLYSQKNLRVVHAHDVKASTYCLRAVQKKSQTNVGRSFLLISTHHGVHARSGIKNFLYARYYERFILPHFDQTLVVCSADKKLLLRCGLKADKVSIHLNGVTREKITLQRRLERQKAIHKNWGLTDEDSFVLGVAARLEKEKRHFLIIKVIHQLKQIAPKMKLKVLCFGRGSLEDKLKKKVKSLGLEDTVFFKGYRAGLGEEFSGFNALLSLSSAEGLPINIIEAGWAATPVFSSNVDGVADLISSPELGQLVESGAKVELIAEELVKFLSSRQQLQQMGFAFQSHVEKNFSQEVWLSTLLQIYSSLQKTNSAKKTISL